MRPEDAGTDLFGQNLFEIKDDIQKWEVFTGKKAGSNLEIVYLLTGTEDEAKTLSNSINGKYRRFTE